MFLELQLVGHMSCYCAMQGGLWEHITAREHIEIYAAIKSLPQPVRSSEAKKETATVVNPTTSPFLPRQALVTAAV
jgi:hypothetical protein